MPTEKAKNIVKKSGHFSKGKTAKRLSKKVSEHKANITGKPSTSDRKKASKVIVDTYEKADKKDKGMYVGASKSRKAANKATAKGKKSLKKSARKRRIAPVGRVTTKKSK